jgi:hypothetical protein
MVAALTCACCPQGSLSTHVLALLACSSRTTAGRVKQVRLSTSRGRGGLVWQEWAATSLAAPTEVWSSL